MIYNRNIIKYKIIDICIINLIINNINRISNKIQIINNYNHKINNSRKISIITTSIIKINKIFHKYKIVQQIRIIIIKKHLVKLYLINYYKSKNYKNINLNIMQIININKLQSVKYKRQFKLYCIRRNMEINRKKKVRLGFCRWSNKGRDN